MPASSFRSGRLNEPRIALEHQSTASHLDFGTLLWLTTPSHLRTLLWTTVATKKSCRGVPTLAWTATAFCVYLGNLGYCLKLALRPGVQHLQSESEYNFERALTMAASLVPTPLLLRADGGFLLLELMQK